MTDVLERYRAMVETPSVLAVDPSALLHDMAAEIERLRVISSTAGQEWRDISSAPRDKTDAWVCAPGWPGPFVAAWFDRWEYDRFAPQAATEGGWIIAGGRVVQPPPTLWMPYIRPVYPSLPAPPVVEKRDNGTKP